MDKYASRQQPLIASALQTTRHENIGVEILALLRSKADAKWEYHNPHFLLAITEKIEAFYQVEDDVVDEWIQEMFSA